MKVILVILALGGYGSTSPALVKLEVSNMAECEAIGQKLATDLRVQRGFGTPYKPGAESVTYSCIEVSK